MKLFILLVIMLGVYALAENRLMLCVRHERVGDGNLRIAHVSDLHKRVFGRGNKRLCEKIIAENPDLILVSGDLVTRDCTDFSAAERVLCRLCDAAPVYVIFGNHETDLPDCEQSKFIQAVKKSGAILLRNETVRLDIEGRKLNLCGAELKYTVYKKNGGYHGLDTVDCAEMYRILGQKPDGETILMVHNPLFARAYAEWGADFAVAGHIHGGAVRIPFTRIGLLSPERKLLPKYTTGVYTVGKMKLLLSGGLGKLRLFNPPEIVIYEL